MADGAFTLAVVTPEERLVDTPARSVELRSSDGELTVLDGHTPLVTDVVPGEVKFEPEEGDPVRLAVHGGFLQVETGPGLEPENGGDGGAGAPSAGARSTRVTLLAGVAELADQIDVPRAERAREEATIRVDELRAATGRSGAPGEAAEAPATPEELELTQAEASLHRAELRLSVAGAD
jgi:F-type H+-transporting ATPase subunit epsilon